MKQQCFHGAILFCRTRKYYYHPRLDAIVAKYFGELVPSVDELQQRALIALINTNPAIDYTEPLPENVIPVGGLHIKDEKPLPSVRIIFFSFQFRFENFTKGIQLLHSIFSSDFTK